MKEERSHRWSVVALDHVMQATGVSRTEVFNDAVVAMNSYLLSGAFRVVIYDQQGQLPVVLVANPLTK